MSKDSFNRRVREGAYRIVGGCSTIRFYRDKQGRWSWRLHGGKVRQLKRKGLSGRVG